MDILVLAIIFFSLLAAFVVVVWLNWEAVRVIVPGWRTAGFLLLFFFLVFLAGALISVIFGLGPFDVNFILTGIAFAIYGCFKWLTWTPRDPGKPPSDAPSGLLGYLAWWKKSD